MRYLDARHAFSKPCDLLSSPVSESLFISSSDPLWCPLFSLLLGFGTVWGKAVPDKEKRVCETLMKAKSHKLCVCPTCSLFYSYIFQSFYLLLFQGGYKKLDLQKGISHHEALQVIKSDIQSLSQKLIEMRQCYHHCCFSLHHSSPARGTGVHLTVPLCVGSQGTAGTPGSHQTTVPFPGHHPQENQLGNAITPELPDSIIYATEKWSSVPARIPEYYYRSSLNPQIIYLRKIV